MIKNDKNDKKYYIKINVYYVLEPPIQQNKPIHNHAKTSRDRAKNVIAFIKPESSRIHVGRR